MQMARQRSGWGAREGLQKRPPCLLTPVWPCSPNLANGDRISKICCASGAFSFWDVGSDGPELVGG